MRQRGNRRRNEQTENKQYEERVLQIDRVARVVKGGRRFRFRALVAVGDLKSKVGIGVAKGADVTAAIGKASSVAQKNMIVINKNRETITHETRGKQAGADVLIMPAGPGTGLIAGGPVRIILELGGVKNALSKSHGSNNKNNVAAATIKALVELEPALTNPKEVK